MPKRVRNIHHNAFAQEEVQKRISNSKISKTLKNFPENVHSKEFFEKAQEHVNELVKNENWNELLKFTDVMLFKGLDDYASKLLRNAKLFLWAGRISEKRERLESAAFDYYREGLKDHLELALKELERIKRKVKTSEKGRVQLLINKLEEKL
ncbi:MAG TPA: hypothetical protein VJK05_05250 [archaeon]|nr:hypothetical protein [archaeon]